MPHLPLKQNQGFKVMKLHYAHVKAARPEAGTDRDTWLAYLNQVYETDVPQV